MKNGLNRKVCEVMELLIIGALAILVLLIIYGKIVDALFIYEKIVDALYSISHQLEEIKRKIK